MEDDRLIGLGTQDAELVITLAAVRGLYRAPSIHMILIIENQMEKKWNMKWRLEL